VKVDGTLTPADLLPAVTRLWEASAAKLDAIERSWSPERGSPVFTVDGRYTTRGWTEWTQGFQYGSALLQFDATGEERFLRTGREATLTVMARHVSHIGVHDHGFNNVSTYGNLWRMMVEGRIPDDPGERAAYELALKVSGAVQAARWQATEDGGYIYSFNGPHSLFVDTLRSCRALALAHQLGHVLMGEHDEPISLRERMLTHALSTARWNVFYGEGRDAYDVPATRGRTAHESLFNVTDGRYRCPSTQQGYSPFTTWTRGLAWAVLGFAELLEWLADHPGPEQEAVAALRRAATATADFYLAHTASDGVPYWDTGAPGLVHLGDWRDRPADPYNRYEPVDSSAAAIAAQGLLRLGHYLGVDGDDGRRYWQAGLTVAATLFDEPYLSTDPAHHGLLLHSVYHRPNGWDHVPPGQHVPNGEASMWGDYHARELALYLQRVAAGGYHTFYGPVERS
jgi:unsaturated chondroitin disaccharide hydrolase